MVKIKVSFLKLDYEQSLLLTKSTSWVKNKNKKISETNSCVSAQGSAWRAYINSFFTTFFLKSRDGLHRKRGNVRNVFWTGHLHYFCRLFVFCLVAVISKTKLPEITESTTIMVTIQLYKTINAYKIYKTAQNSILRLSNFRPQNLSNLDAAIQIFLCLHKANSTVFHFCVTFHHTVAQKYLHCNAMIFVYRVFSRLHLITDLEVFFLERKYLKTDFMRPLVFLTDWNLRYAAIYATSFLFSKKYRIMFVRFWSIQPHCPVCLEVDGKAEGGNSVKQIPSVLFLKVRAPNKTKAVEIFISYIISTLWALL